MRKLLIALSIALTVDHLFFDGEVLIKQLRQFGA
jgi:hypothetical protein